MKIKIVVSLIFGIVLLSCSNSEQASRNIDEHELLYTSTSDSLSNYLNVSTIQEVMKQDSTIKDFTTLDYRVFKDKYSMNTNEMDQLSKTLKVTCEIAKTIKLIEDNLKRAESLNIERLDNRNTDSYSFDKVMPIDTNYLQTSEKDSAILIIMEAFDAQIDTLK